MTEVNACYVCIVIWNPWHLVYCMLLPIAWKDFCTEFTLGDDVIVTVLFMSLIVIESSWCEVPCENSLLWMKQLAQMWISHDLFWFGFWRSLVEPVMMVNRSPVAAIPLWNTGGSGGSLQVVFYLRSEASASCFNLNRDKWSPYTYAYRQQKKDISKGFTQKHKNERNCQSNTINQRAPKPMLALYSVNLNCLLFTFLLTVLIWLSKLQTNWIPKP